MNIPSSQLHSLIKSLSVSEKKFFFQISNRSNSQEEQSYIELFNAIELQNTYDETAIKKIFKNRKTINQLSVLKNYLFLKIRQALTAYHFDNSAENILNNKLHLIEILVNKGLIKEAYVLLKQIKTKAEKEEIFDYLLRIYNWEDQFAQFYSYQNKWEAEKSLNKQVSVIKIMHTHTQVRLFAFSLHQLSIEIGRQSILKNQSILDRLYESFNIAEIEQTIDSLRVKVMLYQGLIVYYSFKFDEVKTYEYSVKTLDLIENNIYYLKEKTSLYLTSLYNLGLTSAFLNKSDQVKKMLKKLEEAKKIFKGESAAVLKTGLLKIENYKISILLEQNKRTCHFQNTIDIIPQILSLKKKIIEPHVMQSHYFEVAYAYFVIAEYNDSLDWISNILDQANMKLHEPIYRKSLMLKMLAHYELNNYRLLSNLLQNTKRSLVRNYNQLFPMENIFLNLLLELINSLNKEEQIKVINEAEKKINKERNNIDTVEYYSWLQLSYWPISKTKGKNFLQIYKD